MRHLIQFSNIDFVIRFVDKFLSYISKVNKKHSITWEICSIYWKRLFNEL